MQSHHKRRAIQWLMRHLVLFACIPTAVVAQPVLQVVGGDSVRFGTVGPTIISRRVAITNIGKDTLHIFSVVPACGCTVAPLDKYVIAPGDTGTIAISFDLRIRLGNVAKAVGLGSDDPAESVHRIWLIANVVRDLVCSSEFFPTQTGAVMGRTYTSRVTLTNTSGGTLTMDAPRALRDQPLRAQFDINEARTLAAGESIDLVARITPLRTGVSSNSVFVRTSGSHTSELWIAIYCNAQ